MSTLEIRRALTFIDNAFEEAGRKADMALRRVAAVVIVRNPHAGRYDEDLSATIDASVSAGHYLAKMVTNAMGDLPITSYGKGGVVGIGGELEHANAMLTTTFAEPIREAVGGALSWIPSFTKLTSAGASIDVPMAHKDALYVRSHYDGMTVNLPPESPAADEVALIVCVANRGRLNARVGGLSPADITVKDGLR